jgi:ribulose-5-phosphate 4-epimerase/fuculose-1-phosphate aldolase
MAVASPVSESTLTREARLDLAAAHRWAVRDGLHEGTWNHLSVVHPEDPSRMLITPSNTHWSQVTASSLRDVGADFDATGLPDMDWVAYRIHYPVHEARPDAACLMHVHSPYVTALSLLEDCEVKMISQAALSFYGRVGYTDELDAFSEGLEQGRAIASALGDHNTVAILRHHGAAIAAPTIADAYTDMYNLERCVMAQMLAVATGQPLREIPEEVIAASSWVGAPLQPAGNVLHFAALRSVLDAEEPDYAN